jgi:hypothetical protein
MVTMNRETCLLAGVGSPSAVIDAVKRDLDAQGITVGPIGTLLAEVAEIVKDDVKRRAFLAVVASILNSSLVKTGTLYNVNDDGRLANNFIIQDQQREIIAALMNE